MNKLIIVGSVGINGKNLEKDIERVQISINQLAKDNSRLNTLKVDGSLGRNPEYSKTVAEIKNVQKIIANLVRPDGRIDPNGRTNQRINSALQINIRPEVNLHNILPGAYFPLNHVPNDSYLVPPRSFGANRSGGRKHAGCDLYAPEGTKVYAMADGEITKFYEFYGGTYALEVKHGQALVRYGEISSKLPENIVVGSKVKQGQWIAEIGQVRLSSGWTGEMLHLEVYDGSASGRLRASKEDSPYQRRKDLVDPTSILNRAKQRLPQ